VAVFKVGEWGCPRIYAFLKPEQFSPARSGREMSNQRCGTAIRAHCLFLSNQNRAASHICVGDPKMLWFSLLNFYDCEVMGDMTMMNLETAGETCGHLGGGLQVHHPENPLETLG